jgi:hypothetical protein
MTNPADKPDLWDDSTPEVERCNLHALEFHIVDGCPDCAARHRFVLRAIEATYGAPVGVAHERFDFVSYVERERVFLAKRVIVRA